MKGDTEMKSEIFEKAMNKAEEIATKSWETSKEISDILKTYLGGDFVMFRKNDDGGVEFRIVTRCF